MNKLCYSIVLVVYLISFLHPLFGQDTKNIDSLFLKAESLKYKNPDSAAHYLNKGYKISLQQKDTLKVINYLIELSQLYSHNVNYGKSYDGYWAALLLADKSKDSVSMAMTYQGLGWLYGFYKRDKEALKYFNLSIKIRKKILKDHKDPYMLPYIGSNYFSIINLYRDIKDYEKMRVYVDSAYQIQKKLTINDKSYYLEAEAAYIDAIDGDYNKAFTKLEKAKHFFENNDPSYLVLINMFYGDIYSRMNLTAKSISYYKESLNISNKYNRHLNTDLLVYESLANLYFDQKNFSEAYKYLKKGKDLNDKIFGRKSENSRHLLEIKDLYRIEKDKQEDLIKQQRITQLEYEDSLWVLKFIILIISIISIILFSYLYVRHLRHRHKNEKLVLKEKQKLELQKRNEILELKNKELTASALRLIEKDEFINNIKKRLSDQQSGNVDVNVIKRVLRSIQGTPTSNWQEFEARFTAINESFYEKLKDEHPELSQTDQKICALVKLNFPSKDMAKLLGISVESVHTSRHRLRKKLNLDRDQNLEEFINTL